MNREYNEVSYDRTKYDQRTFRIIAIIATLLLAGSLFLRFASEAWATFRLAESIASQSSAVVEGGGE